MPPFVDGSQRFPLVQTQLRPKDSKANYNSPVEIDDSTSSSENDSDEHQESLYPLSLDIQVRRLLEHNPPADATSVAVAYDASVVTHDSANLILGSSDTFDSNDGNSRFKQSVKDASVPSVTGDSFNLDSAKSYESSSSLNPSYPTVICSDCDLETDDGDKDSAVCYFRLCTFACFAQDTVTNL
jgi:hypothetical protein